MISTSLAEFCRLSSYGYFFILLTSLVILLYFYDKCKFVFYVKVIVFYSGVCLFSFAPILRWIIYGKRSTENVVPMTWLMRLVNRPSLGLRCEVRGRHILDQNGPMVITMNHQSALDLQALAEIDYFEGVSIIMKRSILYLGQFGLCTFAMGSIFLDRKDSQQCKGELSKVENHMINQNAKIFFFPEGTRHIGKEMLPFRKGAFRLAIRTKAPIVPVVCSSYSAFYNPEIRVFHSGKVIISVLSAISTEDMREYDAGQLADRVRDMMMTEYRKLNDEIQNQM